MPSVPPAPYVKACINGARTPDQHPGLPVSPPQLADAAVAAHGAGAQAVHMHPKTEDGVDSLAPETVAAAVDAVRHALPGLPLGVTTGFWALPDPEKRLRAVESWSVLPDFASVNWHEPGSPELARLLLSRGIGVEIGIFHADAAEQWARSEVAPHCLRVMIELQADEDTDTADDLLARIRRAESPAPILLHGLDASCWPLLAHAGVRGLQTRIGLEDTLLLPDGSSAPGNAELVAAATGILREVSQ
ncbi:3-keto-5-aminohexanoate cleavage protein [Mycobacterium sp. CVI_P3]|uniref:3-keto-5-aminohexanoate cleavage protein n=1 Tax=Mycobacterium pinniadriaticum TaxID=2994102 RepID=A0ABT3SNZ2_9MYCO|nr:3-keto-5-aminohexanoate cleavage protein [Mycobacterium pinniadriaticum]MCX2934831.1 3-keto-5-aminohexanoate cleavage protein [Mycobacterium pinniadriaticum]MCX2941252.1 3-keto-5-aminohexanoate cleavage protein [Mycobacterium pinniadriaticum]